MGLPGSSLPDSRKDFHPVGLDLHAPAPAIPGLATGQFDVHIGGDEGEMAGCPPGSPRVLAVRFTGRQETDHVVDSASAFLGLPTKTGNTGKFLWNVTLDSPKSPSPE